MFILILKYVKPIEDVEKALPSHINYLEKYYKSKKFICSGRLNPRTGGIILCNSKKIHEVHEIVKEDPFYKENIAEYTIIEFSPTKYADKFECFINS